jgi:hypothetical protein
MVAITAVLDLSLAQFFNHIWSPPFWELPVGEIRTTSPIYNHDLLPMRRGFTTWGPIRYLFVTNSLGFRDSDTRQVPLRPAGKRLLIIGDSFTEGLGVRFESTFAGRIQSALRPRHIDVLNAGVASYSPSIYYAKVRHLIEDVGLRFSHLAVFLDMSDIQDEANIFRLTAEGRVACKPAALAHDRRWCQATPFEFGVWARRTINDNSVAGRTLPLVYRSVKAKQAVDAQPGRDDPIRRMTGSRRALWTEDPSVFAAYGKRGLEQATTVMTRLRELCRTHGIEMVLAVYPWPDQIINHHQDALQVRHWRDWSRAHDVRFVDLFPVFINARPPRTVILENYIPNDVHWNARGHARVAARFLKEAGIHP